MYALKARDKLHKQEKKAYEERHSPNPKSKRNDKHKKAAQGRPGVVTVNREAKYLGSYSIDMAGGWKSDFAKTVKQQLSKVNPKDSSHAQMFVSLRINMEGIKVLSPDGQEVIMAHALKRILYCDSKKHLFAIVAKDPHEGSEDVYTHIFLTEKKDQATELNQIVSKAFKVHFTSKTIARQKKEIVKHNPQSSRSRRSPSPQPRSTSSQPPPYNPAVVGGGATPPTHHHQGGRGGASSQQQWTTPSGGGGDGGHRHLSPPAAFIPRQKSQGELMQESGLLELEVATLQSRLQEIQQQMRELAGFEDAQSQLMSQMSHAQQQLDEKRRQYSDIQFQIQDLALREPQPMVATAAATGYSDPPPLYPALNGNDPLPNFGDLSLEDADWFQEGIPREIAMEILSQQSEGAFMVRQSSSSPGSYALTMKAPNNKMLNYLIENVPNSAVRLQGSTAVFPSIVELVYSYTVNRDILPCVLSFSTANPSYLHGQGASDSDEDEEYTRFRGQYRLLS